MPKGGGSNEAAIARKEEEERQARIRQGRTRINTIFDGGTYGTGQVEEGTRYDPDTTYYNADGTVYEPEPRIAVPFGGGAPDVSQDEGGAQNDRDAAYHARDGGYYNADGTVNEDNPGRLLPITGGPSWNQKLKEGLFTGLETTEGFDSEFFDDRRQSYVDFARPQVDQQFGDATEQLTYGLARAGTLDSSIAGDENADLQRQYDINLQDIVDKARQYETEARNSIEDARSDLMMMLQTTGDATGAANAAIARAGALSEVPAYSPVGQLFTDFTSGLSQQAALERAEAATGRNYARYDTGLFGTPRNAVKTT